MAKRKVLGKGLGALIEGADKENNVVGFIKEIAISDISTNPYQPRTKFDEEALLELAQSIKELGVIQPITVTKDSEKEGKYILISGERRFRASQLAGLTTIPAYIKPAYGKEMLEMALVENIQREDLDAISIALGYQRLIEEYNLRQEDLAKRIGKNRPTITNYLRLLKLPSDIQLAVKQKLITMGHARALLSLENNVEKQLEIFRRIQKEALSVREVEKLVKDNSDAKEKEQVRKKDKIDNETKQKKIYEELQEEIANFLGTEVKISKSKRGKGKIEIRFNNEEEFIRLLTFFDKLKK